MSLRKGQSAIEYLTTYGWMILVVAVVLGFITMQISGQCPKTSGGSVFSGQDIGVATWAFTDPHEISIKLRNTGSSEISLEAVEIDGNGDGTYNDNETSFTNSRLTQGSSSETITLTGIGTNSGCNKKMMLRVNYTLTDLNRTVSKTGSMVGKAP